MSDQDFRHPISAMRLKDGPLLALSANGHPAYTPVKLNIKTANDMKLNKTKAPEKPMVPYMKYSRKVWDSVKASHPEAKLWEIGKIIGQMWRELSDVEKQEYIGEYENAKADYCEQLKSYHNSPQYQNFISNASKKKNKMENGIGGMTNVLSSSNIINMQNSGNRMVVNSNDPSSHYAIEPAEDDGIDDGLPIRNLAAVRFNRNHRLLNEIFSEYVVPDNRSIVTSSRMEQLKKQVNSLELHQEKLKQELLLIEEKNELKRKKIINSSIEFQKDLKKLKEFKVTDEQVKKFSDHHLEVLQKEWKEHAERSIASGQHSNQIYRAFIDKIVPNNMSLTVALPQTVTIVKHQQIIETVPNVSVSHQNATSTQQQNQPNQHPPIQSQTSTVSQQQASQQNQTQIPPNVQHAQTVPPNINQHPATPVVQSQIIMQQQQQQPIGQTMPPQAQMSHPHHNMPTQMQQQQLVPNQLQQQQSHQIMNGPQVQPPEYNSYSSNPMTHQTYTPYMQQQQQAQPGIVMGQPHPQQPMEMMQQQQGQQPNMYQPNQIYNSQPGQYGYQMQRANVYPQNPQAMGQRIPNANMMQPQQPQHPPPHTSMMMNRPQMNVTPNTNPQIQSQPYYQYQHQQAPTQVQGGQPQPQAQQQQANFNPNAPQLNPASNIVSPSQQSQQSTQNQTNNSSNSNVMMPPQMQNTPAQSPILNRIQQPHQQMVPPGQQQQAQMPVRMAPQQPNYYNQIQMSQPAVPPQNMYQPPQAHYRDPNSMMPQQAHQYPGAPPQPIPQHTQAQINTQMTSTPPPNAQYPGMQPQQQMMMNPNQPNMMYQQPPMYGVQSQNGLMNSQNPNMMMQPQQVMNNQYMNYNQMPSQQQQQMPQQPQQMQQQQPPSVQQQSTQQLQNTPPANPQQTATPANSTPTTEKTKSKTKKAKASKAAAAE